MKSTTLKLAGFALTVLGAKLWLIGHYATQVPLWDSWGQEGRKLYKPWLEGRFTPRMLFTNNNVHHITLTRLFDLALFNLNAHRWDPRLQMVANALLHVAASTVILAMVYTRLGRPAGNVALGWMVVCLVFPFAYWNILWGYQSQFYFLVFFSVTALWGLLDSPAETGGQRPSRRWCCGAVAAFLACFSMGSGFLAALVVTVLSLGRTWGRGKWRREWPTVLAGAVATVLGLGLFASALGQIRHGTPMGAGASEDPASLVVNRLTQRGAWLPGVGAVTGWPISGGTWPWAGPLLYVPFALWGWQQWRGRRGDVHSQVSDSTRDHPDRWFLAALGLWSLAQAASIGLLRGGPPNSRHLDVLSFGMMVNFIALRLLWQQATAGVPRWTLRRFTVTVAGALWLSVAGTGLFNTGREIWRSELPAWREQMPAYQRAVERFLATDDPLSLQEHPAPFFDHPKWPGMVRLLRDPSIREALSSTLVKPGAKESAERPTPVSLILISLIPGAVPCVAVGGVC